MYLDVVDDREGSAIFFSTDMAQAERAEFQKEAPIASKCGWIP